MLINNYDEFKSLGKKQCFEILSGLVEGKTARQCYERYKKLKLKKGTEYAKKQSTKLLSREAQAIKDCKVGLALKKMCHSLINQTGTLSKQSLEDYCAYVSQICQDHEAFLAEQENSLLFGREIDMADLRKAKVEMRVVPATRDHFKMLSQPSFTAFLGALGIYSDFRGFMRVKNTISKEDF